MTTLSSGSAQIYQFPVGGRAGLNRNQPNAAADRPARLPNVSQGGSWYHDEAIEEAERARNH